MLSLTIYYLVLPFVAAGLVLRLIKKYGGDSVPAEIRTYCSADPIEKRFYRAIRVQGAFGRPGCEVTKLGDFEKQELAIDAAFPASREPGPAARYYVLNDQGEPLQEYKSQ